MFRLPKKKDTSSKLEPIKDKVLDEMLVYGPDSAEFKLALEQLERITKIESGNTRSKVSADTLALVLGNLAGILVIVAYEQKHVFVSKASSFILKAK